MAMSQLFGSEVVT